MSGIEKDIYVADMDCVICFKIVYLGIYDHAI